MTRPLEQRVVPIVYGVMGWAWLFAVFVRIRHAGQSLTWDTFARESRALAFSPLGLAVFCLLNATALWQLLGPKKTARITEKLSEIGIIVASFWALLYVYFFSG